MNVTLIDGSHRDRPSLVITASELISDRTGVILLDAHPVFPDSRPQELRAPSIEELRWHLSRTNELRLSHDWIVKAY